MYDFSTYFKGSSDAIFEEFINSYTSHFTNIPTKNDEAYSHYKIILELFETSFSIETLIKEFKVLSQKNTLHNIPYLMTINEINNLQSVLISKMLNDTASIDIVKLMDLFKKITNAVAYIYLLSYIERMLSINNVRINSLSDIIDKQIISHYESHLVWLNDLAKSIEENNKNSFPELDSSLCEFGQWLHSDAKQIIKNNSKHKAINLLHEDLHHFGQLIYSAIDKQEHTITMTYLEKCEFLSLSIGTELALIDNIVMNKKVTKDKLTGALNRQAIDNIFESQYELSLATNNQFVLAICDLDYFKIVNDTYGHIAGDKMLQLFVETTQKNIRNSDIIIRFGGEEFIIILPAVTNEAGYKVLDKVREAFEESSIFIENEKVQTTVSIGMIEIHPEKYYKQSFLEQYIDLVDKNLYKAKKLGKNKVVSQ